MKRLLIVLTISSIVLLFCCSEDRSVVSSDGRSLVHNVNVCGTVIAYYCSPFYGYNGSILYSVATGRKATIKFLRLNDFSYVFQTDDSSGYDVLIDTGTYEVILETAHALPDTLHDVFISNDTLIDFIFYYQFLNPDTINLEFFYKPISDSLGSLEELTLINKLNGMMGCVIGVGRAIRSAYLRHNRNVYHVTYRAPIDSNYYSWQVLLTANSILAAYEYCFPEELDVHADYIYCLF